MREIKDQLYEQVARIGKAVASPKRLELIELLCQGEKSVELLASQAEISVKLASAHLRELRLALEEGGRRPVAGAGRPASRCQPARRSARTRGSLNMQFGLRANLGQVLQQLLQVLLVGMTISMMRRRRRAAAAGQRHGVVGRIDSAFWFVAMAMGLSGAALWYWGEETHPRLNPAQPAHP